jgi:hypothetical protein
VSRVKRSNGRGIGPPAAYDDWLSGRSTDEARSFLNLYPAENMAAQADPLPPRKPVAAEQRSIEFDFIPTDAGEP